MSFRVSSLDISSANFRFIISESLFRLPCLLWVFIADEEILWLYILGLGDMRNLDPGVGS